MYNNKVIIVFMVIIVTSFASIVVINISKLFFFFFLMELTVRVINDSDIDDENNTCVHDIKNINKNTASVTRYKENICVL